MQINQNNTINGDSSNTKMLYVGCLVFYSFLLFLNVAQIVPIFREQWKTSGSTSSPWSRGCLLPCSRRKGSNTGSCASNSLWDGPTNHPHLEVKCIESLKCSKIFVILLWRFILVTLFILKTVTWNQNSNISG